MPVIDEEEPFDREAFLRGFGRYINNELPKPGDEPLRPDELPMNADWTKQTWDLNARDAPSLRAYLKEQEIDVAHFKTLPVYQLNVNKPGMEWLRDL